MAFALRKNLLYLSLPTSPLGFGFPLFFPVFLRVCDTWPRWGHSWQLVISFSWLLSAAPKNLYFPRPSFPPGRTERTQLYAFQDVKPSVKKKKKKLNRDWGMNLCVCACMCVCLQAVCAILCTAAQRDFQATDVKAISALLLSCFLSFPSRLCSSFLIFPPPAFHFAHISSFFHVRYRQRIHICLSVTTAY